MAIWTAEIKELERLYESFKGQLPDLEKELEQLIKADDENIVLVYARRCLEVIITDLCECELKRPRKTEPLQGIIDKLNKEEKVPSHIVASMHGLNELSTYGAHPKDFDPEQVKPILINLDIIIKWYLKYKDSQTVTVQKEVEERHEIRQQEVPKTVIRKPKWSFILLLSGLFLIIVIIAYPKIFKQNTLENLRSSGERISVAILPFQNLTNDTTWNVWQDVIQDNLINFLSNYTEELQVRQSESISSMLQSKDLTDYASITQSLAGAISQKLNADIFIYGSLSKAGSTLRINAKLVDSKTKEVFKSFQIEGSSEEGYIFPFIDSLSTEIKNFLVISELAKKEPYDFQYYATTNFPEAYSYFLQGKNAFGKGDYSSAIKLFSHTFAVDSDFTFASVFLSQAYYRQGLYEQGMMCCLRSYNKRDRMSVMERLWTNYNYAKYFETPNETIKCLRQIQEIDDQLPFLYFLLGYEYNGVYQYNKAIPEFEKALEIYHNWGIKPFFSAYNYTGPGRAYHKEGKYKKEEKLYKEAEKDFPDDPTLIFRQAVLALTLKDENKANKYIEKFKSIRKENLASEASLVSGLASIYSDAGRLEKAEEYYRQAISLQPENPFRMNYLAWFLIDKDRNIIEG